MTERLYYTDSFLHDFEARVASVATTDRRTAVVLDRSAFYPASGGQIFDTGWIDVPDGPESRRLPVSEVAESEQTGEVVHYLEAETASLKPGTIVHGKVDPERRRDHMQQHSGQHVLSAAFERLYGFATVSFHMGDESCTIDLATDAVTAKQLGAAERLANEVIAEDRPVEIRFATPDEARSMGVRKIPAAEREKLRLIDIQDFDLNACGGTHVRSTGQIGSLLLRKTEKVRQGTRVEFVCGLRAVATARRDYETLTEAAALFSTHIWEVPQQIRKSQEESKAAQKTQHRLLEEVAELQASQMLQAAGQMGPQKLVVEYFAERDLNFIKMLAQKLTKAGQCVALLACGGAQPSLVFAQTPGLGKDMGALMKQAVQALGTRGGGNRDMAQGGAPDGLRAEQAVRAAAAKVA
ncbi:MAG TPA: alanine--tRNA ligase-related protein [Bradyrhizobium sp.]|nr:alanine--tRNA ligase-related protein [Bradyrhizobium sp.]